MWRAGFVPLKENLSRSRKTNERMAEEVRGEDGADTRQEEQREKDQIFSLLGLLDGFCQCRGGREVDQTANFQPVLETLRNSAGLVG